ncbi:MAG: glycosyltransferase family 2 protein [Candidatus Sumerlaeia bacterium]|nr:glycosyltransferase family 2 protein [Candidatus Sumerlaeia bacterium]
MQPQDLTLDLTVLIPVCNEEENIRPLLDELVPILDSMGKTYEVIFVDDGSTDATFDRLTEAQGRWPAVRLIRFDRNYGKTAALVAGWEEARGKIIVIMDGDLQNDPHDIPKLIEPIPDYDLVCGYRVRRHDSWFRRLQSRIANRVRNWVIQDGIRDSGCAFQAIRHEALHTPKFYAGLHRFLPAVFLLEGFKVMQVPVNHRPRLHGRGKYGLWNRMIRAFDDMMAVRWFRTRAIRYRVAEKR